MAKKASKSPKSASAPASTEVTTKGKMVLRVKSVRNTKRVAEEQAKPLPGNKSRTPSKKKKASKVDDKKPKKPPTAFFYFLEDFRKDFQEQNPEVKSMRDVGKACGEKWKTMTYEEKVKYYDIATEKRADFDKATAEYNTRMESGEVEDSDDSRL